MKVLFLDIDGVLNSTRTAVANGGYPHELHHREAFDWTSIKLLQRLCDSAGVLVVLSSAWRNFCDFTWIRKKGSGWRVWRLDGARPPVFTLLKQAAPRQLRVVGPDVARGLPW